jgi:hypothetical protein
MSPEAIAAQAIGIDQAHAAWSAAYATWASVIANFAVVITAVGLPYVLRHSERSRLLRQNNVGARTGLIALAQAAAYSIELLLGRGLESAQVMHFLSEVLMVVREADAVLGNLPRLIVPDGAGVEVLTVERLADLRRAQRNLSELVEHQHHLTFEGEALEANKWK